MSVKKFMEQRKLHIQMFKENLLYNKESYSMDVSPVTTSSRNIQLKFDHLTTDISVKLVVMFHDDKQYITLEDATHIQFIPNIFQSSHTDDLNKNILKHIALFSNQHSFINCFLFGKQRCSFDNNYDTVAHKIKNPADLVSFAKDLKPFLPINFFNSYLTVKFLINDDCSGINIDYILNCRVNDEIYSDMPQVVFKELLTIYACEPLDKNLEELTLRDHVLLQMVKI